MCAPALLRDGAAMSQMEHSIHRNRLLGAMSQADSDRFLSDLDRVPLSLHQIVYQVGAPLEQIYFMEQGIASVLTTMTDGETVESAMIGMEGIVGLPALFGDIVSGQRVIVQAPGSALRMGTAECMAAFDQSTAIRRVILSYAGMLLGVATQTAACNRLHSVKQRTARWLLMMHDRLRTEEMPLTQEFLSTMLAVRRTGITEMAGELQRAGLIRYGRGIVTILNHDGLAKAACECYRNHDRILD
jgi:CRP-like cAMP-binding protein